MNRPRSGSCNNAALIRIYGKPDCIVSDNGTEFTSTAILKWAGETGVAWHYIDPGKPQHRAMVCHWFEDNGEGADRKLQRQSA